METLAQKVWKVDDHLYFENTLAPGDLFTHNTFLKDILVLTHSTIEVFWLPILLLLLGDGTLVEDSTLSSNLSTPSYLLEDISRLVCKTIPGKISHITHHFRIEISPFGEAQMVASQKINLYL